MINTAKYDVRTIASQFRLLPFPWQGNRPMQTMILFPGDTPVDSSTHVWLMTIGLVAYFILRR